jgi:C-terminal processing protease CtpA/Prc
MEVVKVEGEPASKWLARRTEELADIKGFSTEQGARYSACHWGLGGTAGSTLELELRHPVTRKTKKATLTRGDGGLAPQGPVAFPAGLQAVGRNSYGKLQSGFGYIHLRHVPETLPDDLDRMLDALADPPGLVLDCRANGGGGCDHDALFGRFVPRGQTLSFGKSYASAGARPYAGPVVVIVDAGVVSAGETVAGMLKHEIVPYDPMDLAQGVDTQIRRTEELLAKGFPRNAVPYHPERYGRGK